MASADLNRWIVLLRRYARALAGGAAAGDRLVLRFADEAFRDPERLPRIEQRLQLFELYHVWLLGQTETATTPLPPADGLLREVFARLSRLSFQQRALILLVAVGEFRTSEAAAILGLDPDTGQLRLEEAWDEAGQIPEALVLIVENDALTAMDIAAQVEELGHRVVGVAPNADRARQLIQLQPVDLVVTDLSMGGESTGFDLVDELCATTDASVILLTGHPDRATSLRSGLRVQLLSKPFDTRTLQFAILDALAVRASVPANLP
jgi:CheY-like chemotaxis protein/DNA-directed RNA polymerase specialized sigma24 family protein